MVLAQVSKPGGLFTLKLENTFSSLYAPSVTGSGRIGTIINNTL